MNSFFYTDLKTYPLVSTKMYSFVYNNQPYFGQFILKALKKLKLQFLVLQSPSILVSQVILEFS
jgi:hypothetical protein